MAAIPAQLGKGPFDDPSFGQADKAHGLHGPENRLHDPTEGFFHPFRKTVSPVRRVGPDQLQACELRLHALEHQARALLVLQARAVDHHGQDKAQCIHDHMPFAAGDFLGPIVAPFTSRFRCLD